MPFFSPPACVCILLIAARVRAYNYRGERFGACRRRASSDRWLPLLYTLQGAIAGHSTNFHSISSLPHAECARHQSRLLHANAPVRRRRRPVHFPLCACSCWLQRANMREGDAVHTLSPCPCARSISFRQPALSRSKNISTTFLLKWLP